MKTKNIIFWIAVALWAIASAIIGQSIAEKRQFRVNNFDVLPGVGSIQRDADGTFYHVKSGGKARRIHPNLAAATYLQQCYNCQIVRESELSGTNDFCAVASRDELPDVEFEEPCRTGVTLDDGPIVWALIVFFGPLVVWWILLGIKRGIFKPKQVGSGDGGEKGSGRDKFDR